MGHVTPFWVPPRFYANPALDRKHVRGRKASRNGTAVDDLSKRAEMDSPAWHGDELVRREQALFAGHESVEDWEAAKRRIRDILA